MTTNKVQIGSISHGTYRTSDLLESFSNELEYLAGKSPSIEISDLISNAETYLNDHTEDELNHGCLVEDCLSLIQDIQTELEMFAPPYCYFGSHPGDGSDFGFWPDIDFAQEELPNSDDCGDDYIGESIEVNDHGNVTLWQHDGTGRRTEVWSVV